MYKEESSSEMEHNEDHQQDNKHSSPKMSDASENEEKTRFGLKDRENMSPEQLINHIQIQNSDNLSEGDISELMFLVFYILNFPSVEEAEIHHCANRLGSLDIKKETRSTVAKEYCRCCGYAKQDEAIPICSSFDAFPSVGISTYLFFQTIKSLIVLLFLVLIVHNIFALSSNLIISNSLGRSNSSISEFLSEISLNSKVAASQIGTSNLIKNLYLTEMWIGTVLVIFWSLLLYVIKYYARKYEAIVNKETISAADFSIIIENYPRGLSKEGLQEQLNQYALDLEKDQNFFQIQDICMNEILNVEEDSGLKNTDQKYDEMLNTFADWVCHLQENGYLPLTENKRKNIYQKFQKLKNARFTERKKFFTQIRSLRSLGNIQNSENQSVETIAVVTFKKSVSKDLISILNETNITKSIRSFFFCNYKKKKLILKDQTGQQKSIKIQKAPEPEDVKWENLSYSAGEKILRKGATYFATLVLLATSFVIVYILSAYEKSHEGNQFLVILIPFIISMVNFTIGFLIRLMTVFEKDYTETGYQTSLALKSIFAQLLNSIAVPIVVNYIIQNKNIFGYNGLSTDIIYLSITNSFLPPLTRLIDPYHKYILLRAYYYRTSLKQRLLMKQTALNISQEFMEFQTGYQYIYFINLYLFTVFFVSLQPCISIFAILGMFLMYWIEKYSILHRMKRPVPGTDLVNTAMGQMVNLGPIFFSIGALLWSHLLDGYKVQQGDYIMYIPNLVTAGLSAFFFIFPFNVIFDRYLPKLQAQDLEYEQCRILLNSQYRRTNPATMQQAIQQYKQYLQDYIRREEEGGNENAGEIIIDENKQMERERKKSKKKSTILRNIQIDDSYINRKREALMRQTFRIKRLEDQDQDRIVEDPIIENQGDDQQNYEDQGSINEKVLLETQDKIPPPTQPKNVIVSAPKHVVISTPQKNPSPSAPSQKPSPPSPSPPPTKQIVPQNQIWSARQQVPYSAQESNSMMRQLGNKFILSNRIENRQPKIQKQKPAQPKKMNIDFFKHLPLGKEDIGPEEPRNDDYVSFFGKDVLPRRQPAVGKNRPTNPYDKSFR